MLSLQSIHRTAPEDARVHQSGWVPLDDAWEVTALPLVDASVTAALGELVLARLTYRDALTVAAREGAELIHPEHVEVLHRRWTEHGDTQPHGCVEVPTFTGTPIAERTIEHSRRHDVECYRHLIAMGWWWFGWTGNSPNGPPLPTANVGKHWVAGAPAGRSWLMGWWVSDLGAYPPGLRGPGFVQARPLPGSQGPHHDNHHDDGTTTMLVRKRKRKDASTPDEPRSASSAPVDASSGQAEAVSGKAFPTVREGSRGPDVAVWQGIVGAKPDGIFGPGTAKLTKAWQEAHGLVPDAIVGQKSWEAADASWVPPKEQPGPSVVSAAVKAALRDANAAWPTRKKRSDGTLGDALHQARKSDHNTGDAVDITHDPASGANGELIAMLAIEDARCQYVIFSKRIWNRDRAAEGWRPYTGANAHTHHVHISVVKALRNDASPWPWAPR